MDAPVRLVYAGEVLPGHEVAEVRQRLGQWLKLDAQRLAGFFSGRPVVVKRAVPAAEAPLWVQRFAQHGAVLRTEPAPADAQAAPASRAAAPLTSPAPATPRRLTADAGPPSQPADTRPGASGFSPSLPASVLGDGLVPPQAQPTGVTSSPVPAPAGAPSALGGLSLVPVAAAAAATAEAPAQAPAAPVADRFDMVTCPSCGTRQPMQAFCRECVTNLAAALAAQAEERQAQRDASLARRGLRPVGSGSGGSGSVGRSTRRPVDSDWHAPAEAPDLFGRDLDGRMGRMSYLAGGLATFWLMLVGVLLVALSPGIFTAILAVGLTVFAAAMGVRMTVLRLHDINRSAWWALLLLVPTVGGVVSLVLAFWPGTDGDNHHGPQPPERHGIVAALSAGALLLTVVVGGKLAMTAFGKFVEAARQEQADEDKSFGQVTPQQAAEIQAILGENETAWAFRDSYLQERGHRAFAASSQGAYGWSSGKPSPRTAAEEAWKACDDARKPYTSECILVHVDHSWVRAEQ